MTARVYATMEDGFWIATSDDVRGLILAERTLDGLLEKCRALIPGLIKANKQSFTGFALIVREKIDE